MSKYKTLLNILDKICNEAPDSYKKYNLDHDNIESINQARSRALIHLFLKVNFGLLDFEEREKLITDGSYDGGIDAYFIDTESKTTYIIQSKFRTTESNFENKSIDINELANMEIDRILDGEDKDENGNDYNGKIKQFIRELSLIPDIGKYKEKIIILANTPSCNDRAFKKLCNGFSPVIYNFEEVYKKLLFPVVNGTYYHDTDLYIHLNLANKSSSGAKINYEVKTEHDICDITVVFVPTKEIGRILNKYKNAILKYNPRCYLELSGNAVNTEILKTIQSKKTNEFALFNNGITLLSDSTSFNERIGQKDKAQICISNPQIINGGQTAHTLSRVYQDVLENKESPDVFDDKEVLLKIITFNDDKDISNSQRLKLIEDISKATNQQSEVSDADRRSNDKVQVELQEKIFNDFGLYYERKKGEFSDGISSKYIDRTQILSREKIIRLAVAINKQAANARRASEKTLFSENNFKKFINDETNHRQLVYAYNAHEMLSDLEGDSSDKYKLSKYGQALRYGKYSVVCILTNLYFNNTSDCFDNLKENINEILNKWIDFESHVIQRHENSSYFKSTSHDNNKDMNFEGYYKGKTIDKDIESYWFLN